MKLRFRYQTRRRFLGLGSLMLISSAIAACTRPTSQQSLAQTEAPSAAPALDPTPACADAPTPPLTEGPFFTPNSPERTSLLEPGMTGTKLRLTGRVLSRTCTPITGALLEFWQADDRGEYDNQGYRLRGHQFTDGQGRYELETIVPAMYGGRTPHIHVKVQAPSQSVLTTQLFFPEELANQRDRIFRPELVMALQPGEVGQAGEFDFVV
ncbi:MAG: hypothetical protein Kow00121_02730 [Elainellaceae cyanobacterium]